MRGLGYVVVSLSLGAREPEGGGRKSPSGQTEACAGMVKGLARIAPWLRFFIVPQCLEWAFLWRSIGYLEWFGGPQRAHISANGARGEIQSPHKISAELDNQQQSRQYLPPGDVGGCVDTNRERLLLDCTDRPRHAAHWFGASRMQVLPTTAASVLRKRPQRGIPVTLVNMPEA